MLVISILANALYKDLHMNLTSGGGRLKLKLKNLIGENLNSLV